MQSRELALAAARALDEKKGVNVMVLDVQHLTIIADYFVIASGRSANQVRALAGRQAGRVGRNAAPARGRQ